MVFRVVVKSSDIDRYAPIPTKLTRAQAMNRGKKAAMETREKILKKYSRRLNELQKGYIKYQVSTAPMKLNFELSNGDKKFNKRFDYENIIKYVDDFLDGENLNRFLVLPGMSGVGKTTLLFQIYEYLQKEKGINPQNILYFSCNRLKKLGKVDIVNVVNFYLEIYHNESMKTLSQPVFLLIDEAQYDTDWAFNGKLIFDASQNIFMIFTGSSALKLSSNPDASKRSLNIPIHPLTYSQHLKLKYGNFENDISGHITELIFDGEILGEGELERKMLKIYSGFLGYNLFEWKNFLQFGGFPSVSYDDKDEMTKKIIEMVDKIITTDMDAIECLNGNTRYLAFRVLNFLAFQKTGPVSKGSISNFFGADKNLVTEVLDVLEKTQLIHHIEPFTSSVKRTTKPCEYFFATSSLKHNLALDAGPALLEDETAYMGKLLETYVASSFLNLDSRNVDSYKTYYDDSKKKSSDKNVDFIVQRGLEMPIPIEVSFGEKGTSQIKRAIAKYKSSHGVIISNTISNIVKEDNIIYLPAEIFAFM